jgi:glutamine cyclotransferase
MFQQNKFLQFLCLIFWQGFLFASQMEQLVPQVMAIYPHDPQSFTQGLALKNNLLYESSGLYGQSILKEVDYLTGKILKQRSIPHSFFAEGLALVEDRLILLTWREQVAFIYDRQTFKQIAQIPYKGEGWGLCSDEDRLFMSNGTDTITVRDSQSFAILKTYRVRQGKHAIRGINAMTCVGNEIYANRWPTNWIVRFDKSTGIVNGWIHAPNLLRPQEKQIAGPEGVLNGIVYHPQRQTFFLTGKYWPWIFEVRFIRKQMKF